MTNMYLALVLLTRFLDVVSPEWGVNLFAGILYVMFWCVNILDYL